MKKIVTFQSSTNFTCETGRIIPSVRRVGHTEIFEFVTGDESQIAKLDGMAICHRSFVEFDDKQPLHERFEEDCKKLKAQHGKRHKFAILGQIRKYLKQWGVKTERNMKIDDAMEIFLSHMKGNQTHKQEYYQCGL